MLQTVPEISKSSIELGRAAQHDAVAVDKQPKRMEKILDDHVEVEAEVHDEKEKSAEFKNKVVTVKKSLDEQEHQAVNTWKCERQAFV